MLIVCIESPFRPSNADVAKYEGRFSKGELLRQNIVYARLAVLDSLGRNESPLASHLLYTQVWSEKEKLREAGIKAGIEMHHVCGLVALYVDLGTSGGMKAADEHAELLNVPRIRRTIIAAGVKDPREHLARLPLTGFPYLEELEAEERVSAGRIRIEGRGT